ncbi:MAG: DNA glycosylase [Eubacteriales bacterium]|jgi:N-glycosylase/DNA lyase|nr:DNA glycosylase [Eubacteriales bacterium]MDD4327590.1 DNA glycosylase [Eubacteriales bacterium]MDD4717109.1 DNA glycosylase [Eubacteriales bacterium]
MNVKGFETIEYYGSEGVRNLLIKDAGDLSPGGFDAKATFESGQCFRWTDLGDGRYSGIAYGKSVVISSADRSNIFIENSSSEDFATIWHDYLDLSTDYNKIAERAVQDEFMRKAVAFAGGARILRQEFSETLFSYILSSQNNIPRIKGLVRDLCRRHGAPVGTGATDTDTFSGYSFPDTYTIARDFCDSPDCGSGQFCTRKFAGYRCPYIKRTASMIASGEFTPDPERLAELDQDLARKDLCRLPGVGEKVADCVLLYSGIRHDVCPIDTWVEKTIKKIYLDDKASKKEIREFTSGYFGDIAGYAQLWFFYYARTGAL